MVTRLDLFASAGFVFLVIGAYAYSMAAAMIAAGAGLLIFAVVEGIRR